MCAKVWREHLTLTTGLVQFFLFSSSSLNASLLLTQAEFMCCHNGQHCLSFILKFDEKKIKFHVNKKISLKFVRFI